MNQDLGMIGDELVALLTTDMIGLTRGRWIPAGAGEAALRKGCGWVPANLALTPFDSIPADNPWGSAGDLRLMPDEASRFRVSSLPGKTPLNGVLCDITALDGTPWHGCGRSFLKAALADFEAETGLKVTAAFEMEFQIEGAAWEHAPSFSLASMRRADPFGPLLMAALREAGVEPEMVLAEYGRDQFEIVCGPADAVAAADRAVVIREVTREVARCCGLRSTFVPKSTPDGVGNGLHIHFSFRTRDGAPASFDPARPGRVSEATGQFVAGLVRHMPALVALTAPSVVSYFRLRPHHWSAAYTAFGALNREASVRICPTAETPGANIAKAFNLEYRAADNTASPYWALGVMIRAGLAGIREGLAQPPLIANDPDTLPPSERERLGLRRLPETLPTALDAFMRDSIVQDWFHPEIIQGFLAMKRAEIEMTSAWSDAEICRRYAEVY
ncbi:glutamine synthetase [Labrys sp. 22185]|uniref:glutamine synthetase n=1 Tax=Labrys sp. 22185 TaxID=3453888 RepID=UPI003F83EC30